ncbi:hypothetical protein GCM10022237_07120 [Nocardioides ginsengisoli]|uniref:Ig-like domain repeat protein n=1 Tax=Nocardioides ginsengisoli TaxID=363868 RepID=A0ABW3VUW8_9ACTN
MFRTPLLGLATLLTGAALTTVAPTSAIAAGAPAFGPASVQPSSYVGVWDGNCVKDDPPPVALPSTPLVENGPAVTTSTEVSGSITARTDDTDTVRASARIGTRTTLTSAAGVPKALTVTYSGSIEATSTKATSVCKVIAHARASTHVPFTLAKPMWVTLTQTRKGPAYAEIFLSTDGEQLYQEQYGTGLDGTVTATYYLPAGDYSVSVDVAAQKGGWKGFPRAAVSGSSSVTFAPVGARASGPAGNGTPYVALPGARSCATHGATATLTTSAKRLGKTRSIEVLIDGRRAALLKGKALTRGRAVPLRIADDKAASVTATVTLRNGARRTVAARYLACSS